jgi:RES domain-containing protein
VAQYLEIDAPDAISTQTLAVDDLGRRWRENRMATRGAGDGWLHRAGTAILRVPSAIVPATWNVLVNPGHPESAQIRVVRVHRYAIDPRLL